ncbi:Outer membrane protein TolC [Pseudomonas peli]|uniref:Outer membrane protein TolC n=1 Tax=Pseudomonas peli TaxID=592361 RepID=A0AB37Z859_9PSED|nr:TolC family protein [Pseudomonas peli]SCW65541.1 Outer membrane protein TolC [Pseudomonas peli]
MAITKSSGMTSRVGLCAMVVLLSGCASFSQDGGFTQVEQASQAQLDKQVTWVKTPEQRSQVAERVAELLVEPLTVDAAVQVALLNNRDLQASFDALGISEAERVQAGRIPNPGFSFGRLEKGSEVEYERGLHINLARLIAMPLTSDMEAKRFEQVQRQTSLSLFELASQTRKAWYRAVAAQESLAYMQQVMQAAEVSAELARRLAAVGNYSTLQRAQEQSFYADAGLNLIRAEQARMQSREQLIRLLGLWGEQIEFRLPERLPELPAKPEQLPDVERLAMAQRLDIQAVRLDAERLASNLGLSKTTRFINVLELGVVNNRSNEEPTQRGYEISVELPLFDWSGAKVVKAEAQYRQMLNRAAATAINARSQVREAYLGYQASHDVARHYRDEVLPLRARIAEENLLQYNGMFISTFELLADARKQILAVDGYLQAQRDFWIAKADLDMALLGAPSLSSSTPAMAATDEPAGH